MGAQLEWNFNCGTSKVLFHTRFKYVICRIFPMQTTSRSDASRPSRPFQKAKQGWLKSVYLQNQGTVTKSTYTFISIVSLVK